MSPTAPALARFVDDDWRRLPDAEDEEGAGLEADEEGWRTTVDEDFVLVMVWRCNAKIDSMRQRELEALSA